MTSMSVSSARADMHRLLDAVERGDEVTLTRHGKSVAVVIRPDLLRARRAGEAFGVAGEVDQLIEAGCTRPLSHTSGLSVDRADQLAAEVRSGRSGR